MGVLVVPHSTRKSFFDFHFPAKAGILIVSPLNLEQRTIISETVKFRCTMEVHSLNGGKTNGTMIFF